MSETLTTNDDTMQPQYDFSNAVVGRKIDTFYIGLAAQCFVAGELNRRGIFATVTHGASQKADVIAVEDATGESITIEVKAAALPNRRWIAGGKSLRLENTRPNRFWVLALFGAMGDAAFTPRYFVYTEEELARLVAGTEISGVTLADAEGSQAEGRFDKIAAWLRRK